MKPSVQASLYRQLMSRSQTTIECRTTRKGSKSTQGWCVSRSPTGRAFKDPHSTCSLQITQTLRYNTATALPGCARQSPPAVANGRGPRRGSQHYLSRLLFLSYHLRLILLFADRRYSCFQTNPENKCRIDYSGEQIQY